MNDKTIKDITNDSERAFYGSKYIQFNHIIIAGPADGESAFKECSDISVSNSLLCLRYPFWHNKNLSLKNVEFKETARAALWYCEVVSLKNVQSTGVKALRECEDVVIHKCEFSSPEFGWQVKDLFIDDLVLTSEYAFLHSKNISINNLKLKGKYSFQYVKNLKIQNSTLDTKDAFWHSKNVVVKNSTIIGEYLGWYSENLTLINCVIKGTQPLCYAKNLHLVNCTTENCDLSFENTTLHGTILGNVVSIKNPLKGKLKIKGKTNYIKDENDRSEGKFHLYAEEDK